VEVDACGAIDKSNQLIMIAKSGVSLDNPSVVSKVDGDDGPDSRRKLLF
jgi:hypothetical protein